ncbi:MAG: nucleotidyltransferase domain-containing protein [Candidatus Thermoplasmatota archaeon]|nr:nucleotidyltransferase domain-containing protein [Candidatus Thermoplasmatota archaeon]
MKEERIRENIKKIKKIVVPTLKRNGVVGAGIFGSFVKGKVKKSSDVDIPIKFKGRKSLLDLARLEIELDKKLWRKVEILTYSSIHPLLKERILKEEVVIL